MRKTLARIAMLAMPALFTAACGGDLFGPLDGGSGDLAGGQGACVAGTTVHHIMDGSYNTISAMVTQDTCNTPMITAADIMSVRTVTNQTATGTIDVAGSNGGLIGSGPIRCNTGTITADYTQTQAPCTYRTVRSSTMTVTADSTFTLVFQDQESNFQSSGGVCPHATGTSCQVQFTVQMQHQ